MKVQNKKINSKICPIQFIFHQFWSPIELNGQLDSFFYIFVLYFQYLQFDMHNTQNQKSLSFSARKYTLRAIYSKVILCIFEGYKKYLSAIQGVTFWELDKSLSGQKFEESKEQFEQNCKRFYCPVPHHSLYSILINANKKQFEQNICLLKLFVHQNFCPRPIFLN